jgi:hypothetical protein
MFFRSYHLALLLNLSYNHLNQTQTNTVFPTQEEMDRVGFEPTTSAQQQIYPMATIDGEITVQILPTPFRIRDR